MCAINFENQDGKVHYAGNMGVKFSSNQFVRAEHQLSDLCSQRSDIHKIKRAAIHYLCIAAKEGERRFRLSITGNITKIFKNSNEDIIFRINQEGNQYTVWLPSESGIFNFDKYQRIIISDKHHSAIEWDIYPNIKIYKITVIQSEEIILIPYVVFDDPSGNFYNELTMLNNIERSTYRKSEWFYARNPSDVWKYLVNGSIYDPRYDEKVKKRFKCQQCAFAWWNYFGFLKLETNKDLYDFLQDEIAFGVMLDMSEEGEWGHGYWSDSIETHARFHLDGIHLLISQYLKTHDRIWVKAAERGMAFVSKNLTEKLDDGNLWFLHDTKENEQRHRFKSNIFGKSIKNSFCINTHVQALTVLRRLEGLSEDDKIYSKMFEGGLISLRRVLDQQPGTAIYKFLMWLMIHYKKSFPGEFQKSIPAGSIAKKIKNRLLKYTPKLFWLVRRLFPRVVYPGGFTERDLTLSFFSDRYHIINMKDFLTLYYQNPTPWLKSYIIKGFLFIRKYLKEIQLEVALSHSPYYIEIVDVCFMYHRLIEPLQQGEMDTVKDIIYNKTGGYSLDYYASELVNGEDIKKK